MNAERLHVVAKALSDELTHGRIVEILNELAAAAQGVASQPGAAQFQQTLATKRDELTKALSVAPSNNFSPAWRQIVAEIGGSGLLGKELGDHVQQLIEHNQITPVVISNELTQIHDRVNAFKTALSHLVTAFGNLNIGQEDLEPGEAEAGITIPRQAVNDDFTQFTKELHELDFIVSAFVELADGNKSSIPIRTLSSTEFMIYLGMTSSAAAAFAYAAEKLTNAYKTIVETREIKARLRGLGFHDTELKAIEKRANNIMSVAIETTADEVEAKFCKVSDPHRREELKTQIRFSLKKVARRIDRGYNIDVRIGPPTKAQLEDNQDLADATSTIRNASGTLKFTKLGGDPILTIADNTADDTPKLKRTRRRKSPKTPPASPPPVE